MAENTSLVSEIPILRFPMHHRHAHILQRFVRACVSLGLVLRGGKGQKQTTEVKARRRIFRMSLVVRVHYLGEFLHGEVVLPRRKVFVTRVLVFRCLRRHSIARANKGYAGGQKEHQEKERKGNVAQKKSGNGEGQERKRKEVERGVRIAGRSFRAPSFLSSFLFFTTFAPISFPFALLLLHSPF